MDHKQLLASLTDEQRRELTNRSNSPALLHFALHFGLVLLLAGLIAAGIPGWPLLMLPLGILIIFLFVVEHETSHETAFESTALNIWVSRLCGFLILVPASWFRYFHLAHHRHTQDPDNDPELEGGKPETLSQYVWHVTGIPLWWSMIKTLLRNASGKVDDPYVPPRGIAKVIREARLHLFAYAAILLLSLALNETILLYVWVIPALLGQPFLRLYLLAEHGRCLLVANMLENSRTTFTNRLMRWLAWNMPYHAEHHAHPMVPFHKLPEFNRLAEAHLRVTCNGYLAFHRDYAAHLK